MLVTLQSHGLPQETVSHWQSLGLGGQTIADSTWFPEMSFCSSLGFWTNLGVKATPVKISRHFSLPSIPKGRLEL